MKLKDNYHIYAITTIIFWSFVFVFTRILSKSFTAFSIAFIRFTIASFTLIVVMIFTKMEMPHKSDIPWFIAAGAFGFFFCTIAFNKGIATVASSTGSVVIATVPVGTALLARFVYKENLHPIQWFAIGIEFMGIVLLTILNGMFKINIGLFWLFLAVMTFSIYNLFQRKLTQTYTAVQSSSFSIFFGTILLGIFIPSSIKEISLATSMHILYFLILGIFSSAIAYIAWSKAIAISGNASQVSNYMFVTPFLTSILGYLILQEVPDRATFFGGSIILLGFFLFNFGEEILEHIGKNSDRKKL